MNKNDLCRSLPALLSMLILLGLSACAPMTSITTTGDQKFAITPTFVNARFESQPPQNPVTDGDIWINKQAGEGVVARWHDLSLFLNPPNATCNFGNPSASCQRCNACHTHDTPEFCSFAPFYDGFEPLQIYRFDGMMSMLPASETRNPSTTDGCETSPGTVLSPDSNALYQLKISPEFSNGSSETDLHYEAQAHVHVINGGIEPVIYRLIPLTPDGEPADRKYFSWKVTTDQNGVPRDNFSNQLAVGKIRILKGTVENNPQTGGLMITNESIVKPSRIVLIPNYGPPASVDARDNLRCYAQYGASSDGDLDSTQCRHDPGSTTPIDQSATPIRQTTSPGDILTWVVEFNPGDFSAIGGGEVPSLQSGEELVIEFTIQSN